MSIWNSELGKVKLIEKDHVLECDVKGTAYTKNEYFGIEKDTPFTMKVGKTVNVLGNEKGYVVVGRCSFPKYGKATFSFVSDAIIA